MDEALLTPMARLTAWWVIDPLKATWTAYWDLLTTCALLYTALVTPVEVAFIPSPAPSEVYTNGLFITNRMIDLIFIFDMLLCFRLAVRVTGSDGTRWLHSPQAIARNYVTSKWFSLDLFSVCTSIFDFPVFGENAGAKNLIVLRAVRVLRLAKLVRLARGSRLLKRWEMVTALPPRPPLL
jgi:hypothetical protein